MSILIYNYDERGRYQGVEEARRSPRDPDKYLVPKGSTPIDPPKYNPETEIPVFSEETKKWSVVTLASFLPTAEEIAAREKKQKEEKEEYELMLAERLRLTGLAITDGLVCKHRDQLELVAIGEMYMKGNGNGKKEIGMTQEEYMALIKFRQALRDIDQDKKWPNVTWPSITIGDFVFPPVKNAESDGDN